MKTKEDVQTIKPFFQKGFEIQYTSHCHGSDLFSHEKKTNKIKSICHIKMCCTYIICWIG